jgi:hypothetical protein
LQTLSGYSVVRPNREGSNISPIHKRIVLRQQPSTPNDALSHAGSPPAVAFDVVFMCVCYVRDYSETEASYDATCNQVAADIIEAIAVPATNPNQWYTFGGNAINASIGANAPFISSEGDRAGIIVPVRVTYRVSENDHTVVRA